MFTPVKLYVRKYIPESRTDDMLDVDQGLLRNPEVASISTKNLMILCGLSIALVAVPFLVYGVIYGRFCRRVLWTPLRHNYQGRRDVRAIESGRNVWKSGMKGSHETPRFPTKKMLQKKSMTSSYFPKFPHMTQGRKISVGKFGPRSNFSEGRWNKCLAIACLQSKNGPSSTKREECEEIIDLRLDVRKVAFHSTLGKPATAKHWYREPRVHRARDVTLHACLQKTPSGGRDSNCNAEGWTHISSAMREACLPVETTTQSKTSANCCSTHADVPVPNKPSTDPLLSTRLSSVGPILEPAKALTDVWNAGPHKTTISQRYDSNSLAKPSSDNGSCSYNSESLSIERNGLATLSTQSQECNTHSLATKYIRNQHHQGPLAKWLERLYCHTGRGRGFDNKSIGSSRAQVRKNQLYVQRHDVEWSETSSFFTAQSNPIEMNRKRNAVYKVLELLGRLRRVSGIGTALGEKGRDRGASMV